MEDNMNIIRIPVPKYIRYMSQWTDYQLPLGHCIVDKGVTGCGYTEYCLRNDKNIVLCSPRKLLLKNKSDQHKDDINIKYFKNEIGDFASSEGFKESVKAHYLTCMDLDLPCKILVTYDSMYRVAEVLMREGVLNQFHFVVDEFQVIFLDSYFKSEVEFDFVDALQECPNVLYLSATPMLEKYLCQITEFKNLPYYQLNWDDTGVVEKIILKRKFTTNLTGECVQIINDYLDKKYEVAIDKYGKPILSEEAVFYFNSLGDILKIIRKSNLKPDQVNIICADTPDNKAKISKLSIDLLGKKTDEDNSERFTIGEVPLKGEPNKMFTFCTRTAYIGADFHSHCARSFVFADPNISCLALDISLDLPQIVGRQRDEENPYKNDITVFYRTIRKDSVLSRDDFDQLQQKRESETTRVLSLYQKASEEEKETYLRKLKSDIRVSQYSEDFVSISKRTNQPVKNEFIRIANERAWEVSQKDYQDQINVTKALEGVADEISEYLDENEKIAQEFLDYHFYLTGVFRDKLKMYCEFMDQHQGNKEIEDIIYFKIRDERFRKYYNFYGTSGCRAVSYEESKLLNGMYDATKEDELKVAIYKKFKVGQVYSLKSIKEELGIIYRNLGIITKTPKATDLAEYFSLIRFRYRDENKKRIEAFKLEAL